MADRPLACPEWQAALAGWLTADVSPEDEAALLAHLEGCAACRAEADSLHAVSATLLTAVPDAGEVEPLEPAPPPDLSERIVHQVRTERRRPRTAGVAALAGAAVIAVVLAVALIVDRDPVRPSGTEVAFSLVPDGASVEAVMVDDAGGTVVHLEAEGLEPGVTYALWMAPLGGSADDRVPAGTFRPDDAGAVDVELPCVYPASQYVRVWATDPEGEVVLDTT